jgi:hypothetical protein
MHLLLQPCPRPLLLLHLLLQSSLLLRRSLHACCQHSFNLLYLCSRLRAHELDLGRHIPNILNSPSRFSEVDLQVCVCATSGLFCVYQKVSFCVCASAGLFCVYQKVSFACIIWKVSFACHRALFHRALLACIPALALDLSPAPRCAAQQDSGAAAEKLAESQ